MNRSDLSSLLSTRYGWRLDAHGPDALERALRQRMLWLETSNEREYLAGLDRNPQEFQALLEELVVPESWFFREREAIALATRTLAQKYSANPTRPLRVLSAPCSRGEEPVSLAISLLGAGIPLAGFQIDAIDLSAVALEQARRGVYTGFSFRGDDLYFRDQAFEAVPGGWRIRDMYRAPVTYQAYNLLALPEFFKSYDIIFCRNLLIYLTDQARQQLFELFHRLLLADGVLFLAACEFALPPGNLYSGSNHHGSVQFRKNHGNYLTDLTHATPKSRPPKLPHLNPKPPASRPIRPPRDRMLPFNTDHRVGGVARPPSFGTQAAASRPNVTSYLDQAENFANLGHLEQAALLCREALQAGPSSRAYYLLAVIDGAQNKPVEAEANLRRALYLEPENRDALAQLALFREKAGDLEGSRRLRERMKR